MGICGGGGGLFGLKEGLRIDGENRTAEGSVVHSWRKQSGGILHPLKTQRDWEGGMAEVLQLCTWRH